MASQKEKLLKLLVKKLNGVTSQQAVKYGVNNASKRVYDLRQEGYVIDTVNSRVRKGGGMKLVFRLDDSHR